MSRREGSQGRTIGLAVAREGALPAEPAQLARQVVARLGATLDRLLDRPIESRVLAPNLQRLTVLSAVDIVVDSAARTIRCTRGAFRPPQAVSAAFEVGRALDHADWLVHLVDPTDLARLLACPVHASATRPGRQHRGTLAHWAVDRAHAALRRDARFQALRRALAGALPLPSEVLSIALRARPDAVGERLSSEQIEVVWRDAQAFGLIARENPRLLGLAMALALASAPNSPFGQEDPVAALKRRLRETGLAEVSWRYATRHGARLFKPLWSLTGRDAVAWPAAIAWLRALEYAGLPPPPPPALARTFLRAFNAHSGERLDLIKDFHKVIPSTVLRQGLLQASSGRAPGFEAEFLGVCAWAERQGARIDRNLARAGWGALARRWREDEAEAACLDAVRRKTWTCSVAGFDHEGFRVEPIEGGVALVREARAMHNCLHEYVDRCVSGAIEFYSVRDATTGRRLACVGIAYGVSHLPLLVDVRGFANTPVRPAVWRTGEAVAARARGLAGRGDSPKIG